MDQSYLHIKIFIYTLLLDISFGASVGVVYTWEKYNRNTKLLKKSFDSVDEVLGVDLIGVVFLIGVGLGDGFAFCDVDDLWMNSLALAGRRVTLQTMDPSKHGTTSLSFCTSNQTNNYILKLWILQFFLNDLLKRK